MKPIKSTDSFRVKWAGKRLQLRPPGPADETFLLALFVDARAAIVDQLRGLPDRGELLLRQMHEGQQSTWQTQFGEAGHRLVLADGEAVGRLWTAEQPEAICLVDIALARDVRGRGLGRCLLNWVIAGAADKPVTLHVARDNAAQHLYARLGFEVIASDALNLQMVRRPSSYSGGQRR
jgi:ribosomal protein S18 acetylase RimI-like enzyme